MRGWPGIEDLRELKKQGANEQDLLNFSAQIALVSELKGTTMSNSDLMQLARQARDREGLLARPLFRYQEVFHLSDEQLAAAVGVPVSRLASLALCQVPVSEDDLARVAGYVEADVSRLSAWLKVWLHAV